MIVAEPFVKDAAWWTEWHLGNWSDWMRRGELPEGMPDQASGGAENYTNYDADSERAYSALDMWAADTTNAVVHGLQGHETAAIYHAYLDAVYRFMRGNYEEILMHAKDNVQVGLRRRGVWLGE